MSTIVVAIIVAISATITPLLLSLLTNKQRRQERAEDWARQDAVKAATDKVAEQQAQTAKHVQDVADQAAKAAALLVISDAENRRQSKAINTQLTEQHGQLDQLHTLANDNLSAAMAATLEATRGQLILMRRIPSNQITEQDAAAILLLQSNIAQQEATLAQRAKQTAIGQAQAKETK